MKVTFERACAVVQIVLLCVICGRLFSLPPAIDPELRWLLAYNAAIELVDKEKEQHKFMSISDPKYDDKNERITQLWARALFIARKINREMPLLTSEQIESMDLKLPKRVKGSD